MFTMPPHTTTLLILTHGDAADPILSAVQQWVGNVESMSRVSWNLGDDPWRILSGGPTILFVRAEMAAQRLPVRLSVKGGRDLVP
jgi:hypothetical protein